MLVVLGPPFEGTDDQYGALSRLTGLVAYELRTKLKPGYWGVVRALADAGQAETLAERLREEGFRATVVDPAVGHDPERRIVSLLGLEVGETDLGLQLRGRVMAIPNAALLTLVRGEVHIGRSAPQSMRPSSSSSTFRAVVPSSADLAVFREQTTTLDAYAAADLHFVTVGWVARIDARAFDFSSVGLPTRDGLAAALDTLVDALAERFELRVDRGSKTSSLLSFTARQNQPRQTPMPGGAPASIRSSLPPATADEKFDAYSRFVAEAERRTRRSR